MPYKDRTSRGDFNSLLRFEWAKEPPWPVTSKLSSQNFHVSQKLKWKYSLWIYHCSPKDLKDACSINPDRSNRNWVSCNWDNTDTICHSGGINGYIFGLKSHKLDKFSAKFLLNRAYIKLWNCTGKKWDIKSETELKKTGLQVKLQKATAFWNHFAT